MINKDNCKYINAKIITMSQLKSFFKKIQLIINSDKRVF